MQEGKTIEDFANSRPRPEDKGLGAWGWLWHWVRLEWG